MFVDNYVTNPKITNGEISHGVSIGSYVKYTGEFHGTKTISAAQLCTFNMYYLYDESGTVFALWTPAREDPGDGGEWQYIYHTRTIRARTQNFENDAGNLIFSGIVSTN